MADMLVKLYNIPHSHDIEENLLKSGIRIKKALAPDRSRIIAFARTCAKDDYSDEVQAAFSNNPVTCYIATREKEPVFVNRLSNKEYRVRFLSVMRTIQYRQCMDGGRCFPRSVYENIFRNKAIYGSDGCRRNFWGGCVLPEVVRMKEAANRGKGKTLLISAGIEIMLIICIIAANLDPTPILYFVFYNLLYGLIFSLLIPLYCLYKENGAPASSRVLAEVGFKKPGIRQWVVLFAFVVFSVGGQLIPKMAAGEQIPWRLLPMGIVPLIMTTFFEEFLFRGFVQSRIERQFGWVPAILISGAMFSLYHLGYPGFRTWEDILLLFPVGIGFAAAYKLSGNNLIVSFFVNLPNAFVTYILKYEQFPVMRVSSTIAAAVTLVLIGLILLYIEIQIKGGNRVWNL